MRCVCIGCEWASERGGACVRADQTENEWERKESEGGNISRCKLQNIVGTL